MGDTRGSLNLKGRVILLKEVKVTVRQTELIGPAPIMGFTDQWEGKRTKQMFRVGSHSLAGREGDFHSLISIFSVNYLFELGRRSLRDG